MSDVMLIPLFCDYFIQDNLQNFNMQPHSFAAQVVSVARADGPGTFAITQ
jgi:hypothetical protein